MSADITRIPVPSLPKGQVRRKIPKPFARPSISVGAAGSPAVERRYWQIVNVVDLKVGDIVPGIGRVFELIEKFDSDDRSWTMTVKGGLDNIRVYGGNETVWAFASAGVAGAVEADGFGRVNS